MVCNCLVIVASKCDAGLKCSDGIGWHRMYATIKQQLSRLRLLCCRYGESEKLLADVFKAAETLNGAIVFFDEIDSLATAR